MAQESATRQVPRFYVYPNRAGIATLDSPPLGAEFRRSLPAEKIAITDERVQLLQELAIYQVRWVQDNLGIDVSRRISGIPGEEELPDRVRRHFDQRIFFYSEEVWRRLRTELKLARTTVGVTHTPSETIIVGFPETGDALEDTSHELVHLFGGRTLVLGRQRQENGVDIMLHNGSFSGYDHPRVDLKYVSEAVTELLNLHILHDFRRDKGIVRQKGKRRYEPGVVFLMELVKRAATKLQTTRRALLTSLYTGYYESDHQQFAFILDAFGEEGFDAFTRFTNELLNGRVAQIQEVLDVFGIDMETYLMSAIPSNFDGYVSQFFSETEQELTEK